MSRPKAGIRPSGVKRNRVAEQERRVIAVSDSLTRISPACVPIDSESAAVRVRASIGAHEPAVALLAAAWAVSQGDELAGRLG